MQYFSNVELAKLYGVSEGTVRRWIEAARKEEIELKLYEHDGITHIANTLGNKHILKQLASRTRNLKQGSTRWHRVVSPHSNFYNLYTQTQIKDIISSIEIHREFPLQYFYFGPGAHIWDKYVQRLSEMEGNTLTTAVGLLQSLVSRLDSLVGGSDVVNVVDLGVGNALPIKELLAHFLHESNKLGRYIGIDLSHEMLEIAEHNVQQWFKGDVVFEGCLRDFSFQRFRDLTIDEGKKKVANLVLLLGGTLNNFRQPSEVLRTVHHSLGPDDIFVTAGKIDSADNRRSFDARTDTDMTDFILNLFNIDPVLCEMGQAYDEVHRRRIVFAKLKTDLTLVFKLDSGEKQIQIRKGEALVLWHVRHQSSEEVLAELKQNEFDLLEASLSQDHNFMLTMSKIHQGMHLGV